MLPDHGPNGMSGSNGSHRQLPERISNENDFWLSYGYLTVHFGHWWSVLSLATSKIHTSLIVEFTKGLKGYEPQISPFKSRSCRCHNVIGPCWPHEFICCRPWPQAKDTVNASSFPHGFLGPWDGMAEPAMAAVAMFRGGVPWFTVLDILCAIACDNFFYRTSITVIYDLLLRPLYLYYSYRRL